MHLHILSRLSKLIKEETNNSPPSSSSSSSLSLSSFFLFPGNRTPDVRIYIPIYIHAHRKQVVDSSARAVLYMLRHTRIPAILLFTPAGARILSSSHTLPARCSSSGFKISQPAIEILCKNTGNRFLRYLFFFLMHIYTKTLLVKFDTTKRRLRKIHA